MSLSVDWLNHNIILAGSGKSGRFSKTKLTHERYKEIERENKILLDKMTNIMRRNNSDFDKPFEKKSLNKDARK